MKKMLPVVMGAIFALSVPASGYDVTGVYPHTGKVISVEEVTVDEIFCDYLITIVDCAGRSWAWFDDAEDWEVDDLASVIMYDNGTPDYVYDDEVISARYVGIAEWLM